MWFKIEMRIWNGRKHYGYQNVLLFHQCRQKSCILRSLKSGLCGTGLNKLTEGPRRCGSWYRVLRTRSKVKPLVLSCRASWTRINTDRSEIWDITTRHQNDINRSGIPYEILGKLQTKLRLFYVDINHFLTIKNIPGNKTVADRDFPQCS